jgi:alpha-glucosidase (family GH31 glycosyl hydrolase)
MLGSEIMMAPILKTGHTRRDVYMPQGSWMHYFTHELYDYSKGGAWLKN